MPESVRTVKGSIICMRMQSEVVASDGAVGAATFRGSSYMPASVRITRHTPDSLHSSAYLSARRWNVFAVRDVGRHGPKGALVPASQHCPPTDTDADMMRLKQNPAHAREVGVGQHEAAREGRLVEVHLQLHLTAARQLLQPLVQRLQSKVTAGTSLTLSNNNKNGTELEHAQPVSVRSLPGIESSWCAELTEVRSRAAHL